LGIFVIGPDIRTNARRTVAGPVPDYCHCSAVIHKINKNKELC
jgi:hypothetical protein